MSDQTPQAVEACHDLLRWLIPKLDAFPRSRRFTLGERLESVILEVLELLVAAAYTRDKAALLEQANRKLSVARHLWRLAWELKLVNSKTHQYAASLMLGIGEQVGGWLRSARRSVPSSAP